MKRAVISFSVIICFLTIFSENLYSNYPISVGPYIGLKGGVNAADVPNGTYNGFAFSNLPEMGVSSYFPFVDATLFGGGLNLAYSTHGFTTKENDIKTSHQYNYLGLSPYLYANGFILGINIGIPLSGTTEKSSQTTDVKSEELTTLTDIKLGGVITVYANEFGRFNIMIEGSYSLSGMLKDNYSSDYNYHPGQLWFGLNYMFNLQKPVTSE
ncbi:MAG: hypothetical protein V1779_08595 [bacterium]